jgi:hypothetical protein
MIPEIIVGYPPNFERIKGKVNLEGAEEGVKGFVFAYNGRIYNPAGLPMVAHLILHEQVHFKQQKEIGGADLWWDKWLEDDAFRLSQELEAYGEQYAFILKVAEQGLKDRNRRTKETLYYLNALATDMSSEIYGNLISYSEAKAKIRDYAKTK